MLRFMRRGQRWLTALLVAGVGVVFVFFMGWGAPRGRGPGGPVVEVGSYRFGLREFERVRAQREEQLRQAAGEGYDAKAFQDLLNDFAIQALRDRAILALEAQRLGLTVSKQEVEDLILGSGAFQEGGHFDAERFRDYVQYEFGTEQNFLRDQRTLLLAQKMVRLIHDLPRVSDAEARDSLRLRLEEVRLAFVALDPSQAGADTEIEPERLESFLAEREPEVRALYDSRSDVYDAPERVRARHILLRVPPGADEETVAAVEARAKQVLARVRGGEDFAAVAEEVSEDPGSKSAGGDLGFFTRGRMVAPFEEAAFSLEPGTISDLVRTDFGFHIIRVEEHREAESTPYEEVREDLARELLAAEAGRDKVRQTAETLAAAVRDGSSLEAAARAEGLTLERTGWLRRRPDGFVPGLGAAQDLLATSFAMAAGQSSDRIFEVGEKLALVQVLERKEPEDAEIEAGLEAERERLLTAKRNAETDAWLAWRRRQLTESGDLVVNLAAVPR